MSRAADLWSDPAAHGVIDDLCVLREHDSARPIGAPPSVRRPSRRRSRSVDEIDSGQGLARGERRPSLIERRGDEDDAPDAFDAKDGRDGDERLAGAVRDLLGPDALRRNPPRDGALAEALRAVARTGLAPREDEQPRLVRAHD